MFQFQSQVKVSKLKFKIARQRFKDSKIQRFKDSKVKVKSHVCIAKLMFQNSKSKFQYQC